MAAIKKDFSITKGIQVQTSIKIGDAPATTNLVDSSTVIQIAQEPATAASITSSGGLISKVYDSADLLPTSGNTAGDFGFVNSTNRLYLWNGSGWYNIALVNTSPTFDSGGGPDSSYTVDSSVVITLLASDPEEVPIQYSYVASDSASNFATISQSDNVFTITRLADAAIDSNGYPGGGTFTITFKASDGINIVPAVSSFTVTIITGPDWSTGSLSQTIDGLPTQYNRYTEKFGTDCDLSSNGDYAIIGSPDFLNIGRTFIFYRSGSTWSQQAAIDPSNGGGLMGNSVAINSDGDTAIVSQHTEYYSGAGYGAVYIYVRSGSTWSQQARLTSSYNVAGTSRFGQGDETDQGKGVDISDDGNVVIIGAINEDPSNIANAGRAYIFRRSGSTWSLDAALQASDPQAGDVFGWSVSISGDGNYAVIGAREESGGSGNPYSSIGASYVFTYSSGSWSQQAKLTPNPLASAQNSGHSVGIDQDGDTIAVGALYEDTTATNSGAVYVFTRSGSTWTQQETLKANDAAAHDNLGTSVDISNDGDIISVGAMNEDDSSTTNNGAIYIFKRSGSSWSQVKKFAGTLTDQKLGKQHRMSKDATVIISGDYKYNSNQGRAYIFEASE
jgi:hypothetical protein